ncbi:MAG: hypothetical protein J5880_01205 [Bacilli bacterium]|nr:hypothetical protein [Bacilli bacterium]
MNGKSILFSILSLVTVVLVVLGDVMLFKTNIAFGFLGILLLFIPAFFQRKALSEANGGFDLVFAKFIVPALAVLIVFGAIMAIAFWIQW